MSMENELKRIADALERITTSGTVSAAVDTAPTPGGAPDLMPVTSKGRGKGKNTVSPAAAPAVTPEPPKPEVSKADITSTLQAFLKKFSGPEGAEKARVFFTNAGAKNITTLDPLKYKEVFLGLQQAMK